MFGEFISHPTCLPTPNFHEKLKAYDLHTGDKESSHTVTHILDDSENGLESSVWNSALRNTVIQCFFCFCPSLVCWNTSFRSPKLEELAPRPLRRFRKIFATIGRQWFMDFCAFHTVDGRTPAPVEVGSFSHYLQIFLHPRWLFGISEPSTVSLSLLVLIWDAKAYPFLRCHRGSNPGGVTVTGRAFASHLLIKLPTSVYV